MSQLKSQNRNRISGSFLFTPPVRYAPPPVAKHVPLQSKSLCKIMVRASGDANYMHPLSWGGGAQTEKSK